MRYMQFYFMPLAFILYALPLCAQRNNIWCFGDSAGINFNNGSLPYPISSAFRTRGTCTSIADSNGDLLFYTNTRSGQPGDKTGLIWNKNNQIMLNADSIFGDGWYYEMVIIPDPDDDSTYYLFSIGVAISFGLTYCKIDMRGDGGLGEVVQKNITLLGNMRMVDCLLTVKHGNGRDWWVIVRESTFSQGTYNNSWYVFLVAPSGISGGNIQNVGTLNPTNSGRLAYDTLSNRICFVNSVSLVELYDFDRCVGIISNRKTIEPPQQIQPHPWNWSCEFSPSGQFLFVSSWINNDSSYLWQYDTWAANIASSKTLIWQSNYPVYYVIGQLKRAPDGKIYLSNGWVDTIGNYYFPYLATQYYPENMNLSVINSPDLPGASCDFQPYSFYLGGKRTYWGLPNNPDYDLGPLIGSPCDTLVGINESAAAAVTAAELFVYYAPGCQTTFINAQHVAGSRYSLEVFDMMGKSIFRESGKLNPPYFTKNLNCGSFALGVYTVVLITEKERLVKRFVVE
jgi:hypothetical protein